MNRKNIFKIFVTIFFLINPFLFGNTFQGNINPQGSDTSKIMILFEKYYKNELVYNPIKSTQLGFTEFNDKLGNFLNEKSRQNLIKRFENYHGHLKSIDRKSLNHDDKISYDLFFYDIKMTLEYSYDGYIELDHMLPLNQICSIPITLAKFGEGNNAQPFKTIKDYKNWLHRAGEFPRWVDEAIVNMNKGIEKKIVFPRVIIDRILQQLEILTLGDEDKRLFYKPIHNFPPNFNAKTRKHLTTAYLNLINHKLIPAYSKLYTYIKNEYRPHSRESIGLHALQKGSDWYKYLIRYHTTTDLTPETIHLLGKEQVNELYIEIQRVKDQLGFTGNMSDFFNHLRTDPQFLYNSPEEMIQSYRLLKESVNPKLISLFKNFPNIEFIIRPIEAYRHASVPNAYYQAPSFDCKRPGIFYINTFKSTEKTNFQHNAMFLHEAIPGHHFQIALAMENTQLPNFQKHGTYTAYTEGWGHYAESLGKEIQFYDDPYQYIGALYLAIWRANRLVVDTGIHFYGWNKEQAVAWMQQFSPASIDYINTEIDRYISYPGEALSYTIGAMTIQHLRDQAKAALGSKFDIKEFHHEILCHGALPLHILQKTIHSWIKHEIKKVEINNGV